MKPDFSLLHITARVVARFWKHVKKTDDCWVWTGATRNGYGVLNVEHRAVYAHRISHILHKGPIPEGLEVLHRCDNRPCIKPEHLFPGTQLANVQDMHAKGRARKACGERAFTSRLTAEQVSEIRESKRSGSELARSYGVGRTAIYDVKARRSWRHV